MGSMTELRVLTNYYEEKLLPGMKKYEVFRIILKSKNILLILIIVLSTLFFVLVLNIKPDWITTALGIIFLTIMLYILTLFFDKRYTAKYQEVVIDRLMQFYKPEWDFSSHGETAEDSFTRSKLFNSEAKAFSSRETVRGSMHSKPFECSKILAERIDPNSAHKNRVETIFSGLFFTVEINRDNKRDLFISLSPTQISFKTNEVTTKCEIPIGISIYTNDQQQARQFIDMELYKMLQSLGIPLRISLVHDTCNIAIQHFQDVFSPSIGFKKMNKWRIEKLYELFSTLEKIVEKLTKL